MRLRDKRRLAQAAAFLACNMGFTAATQTGLVAPFMFCHGCPLASFACPIGALQHFLGAHTAPLFLTGFLALAFLVLGRAACGWLCPFGALQDLLARLAGISKARGPPSAPRLARLDRAARKAKFLVLLGTIAGSWALAGTTFCWFCPVGALFAGIPYKLTHMDTRLGLLFYAHLAVLALVLVIALLLPRAWCRYACPLGAIAGLFNRLSLIGIELDRDKCVGCGACLEACPMGLRSLDDIGTSVECILCGRCAEACPTGALRLSLLAGSRE